MVLIDEVGPMEMTGQRFGKAVSNLFQQDQMPVIATYKRRSYYSLIESALREPSTLHMMVTLDNRNQIFETLSKTVESWLSPSRGS